MDGTDRLAALEAKIACAVALTETVATKDARIAELERLLEESRRSGKRQSAPFSKGKPKEEWETPGRKKGDAHGRHGHRPSPPEPDRFADAPLPECCPHCGDGIDFERWAEQFQTELPGFAPS